MRLNTSKTQKLIQLLGPELGVRAIEIITELAPASLRQKRWRAGKASTVDGASTVDKASTETSTETSTVFPPHPPINNINHSSESKDSSEWSSASEMFEDVMAEWNSLAAMCGLAAIKGLDEERRKLVRARVHEHGEEGFGDALCKVRDSPFCRGEVTKWKATFDWFIRKSSMKRLLEGNYDEKAEGANVIRRRFGNGATTHS